MCGFLSAFGPAARASAGDVQHRLATTLRHRGPDDFQTLTTPHGHIMFWRLSIVDVVGGRQPMKSADGQATIVFNGEVYNYRAVRRELERAGHRFRTESDTEVLLVAYQEWGAQSFSRFEGMFAVCAIDEARGRVVLARDRLGVKPLYFHASGDSLVVASEQKAILAHLQMTPSLDRSALASYLVFQTIPDSRTFFAGVSKVPPGFVMEFDLRHPRLASADPISRPALPPARTYQEMKRRVRKTLTEQVDLALDTDLPICFHLSGGLDSNLLVGLCRQLRPGRAFTCVTSIVGGDADPEWPFIAAAARAHRAPLRRVDIDADSFFDCLDDVVFHLDEPVGDPGVVAQFLVNRAVSEESKIVFSGQGLDEMFFGYARDLAAGAIAMHGLESLNPGSAASKKLHRNTRAFFVGWEGFLASLTRQPVSAELALFRKLCRLDVLDTPKDLDEASLRPLRDIALDAFCRFRAGSPKTFDFMIDVETGIQLPSLLHMEDRASMRYSVESRVPFCTSAVLDVAKRGRLEWSLADGKPKGILRDAFSDVIPKSILRRREKVGRPIPFRRWLSEKRGAPYLDELKKRQASFRELLGVDFVKHGLEHPNPFDRTAWAMVSMSRWIERYGVTL